jgi:cobalamin biosynthesis Mg chelatase CobN
VTHVQGNQTIIHVCSYKDLSPPAPQHFYISSQDWPQQLQMGLSVEVLFLGTWSAAAVISGVGSHAPWVLLHGKQEVTAPRQHTIGVCSPSAHPNNIHLGVLDGLSSHLHVRSMNAVLLTTSFLLKGFAWTYWFGLRSGLCEHMNPPTQATSKGLILLLLFALPQATCTS